MESTVCNAIFNKFKKCTRMQVFHGGESNLPDIGFLRLSLEFSSRYSDVTVCSVRNILVTYYML